MKRPPIQRPENRKSTRNKAGQALLESFAIMMLLCLILFGIVQYVLMLTATEVVQYSADASVRARAVGFNHFMVYKASMVARIPLAGRMTTPGTYTTGANWNHQMSAGNSYFTAIASNPSSDQYTQAEHIAIPQFLNSDHGYLFYYLDYNDSRDESERRWRTWHAPSYYTGNGVINLSLRHDYLVNMPFARAFMSDDVLDIHQRARLADHAELYLQ